MTESSAMAAGWPIMEKKKKRPNKNKVSALFVLIFMTIGNGSQMMAGSNRASRSPSPTTNAREGWRKENK